MRTAIQTASDAFGVPFTPSSPPPIDGDRDWLVRPSGPCGHRVLLRGDREKNEWLEGEVSSPDTKLLDRLAATTILVIQQQDQLNCRDEETDSFIEQMGIAFEQLVWTRKLAETIESVEVRQSLTAVAASLLPQLVATISAQRISLIQYEQPVCAKVNEIPEFVETTASSVACPVSREMVAGILREFGPRARLRPFVSNDRDGFSQRLGWSSIERVILVPIRNPSEEYGWLLAVNRTQFAENGAVVPIDDVDPAQNFGTFEAGLLAATASFLASHAHNNRLFADQEELLLGIVSAMVRAIDAKDHYTKGHSDRVSRISKVLARTLNLSEQDREQVALAGLLHDIGKIGVPDEILTKPGKLTSDEFERLKEHPVIGYDVLRRLRKLEFVLGGVRHHHESFDGTGYPDQLVGEEIPLFARIIAVADALDAMTSNRPYRKGRTFREMLPVLLQNIGPQWDPQVIQALVDARHEISEICMAKELEEFESPTLSIEKCLTPRLPAII